MRPLVDAFERLKGNERESLPQMAHDATRAELDEAANRVARLNGRELARWREAIGQISSIRG